MVSGRWHDQTLGSQSLGSLTHRLARLTRTDEIGELDAQRPSCLGSAQVEDRQVGDVDAPQPSALTRRIHPTTGRCLPLGPRGRWIKRGVERPGVSGAVVSGGRGGGA